MNISGIFDNVDTAEHALVNMQSLGISPTTYKIKALDTSFAPKNSSHNNFYYFGDVNTDYNEGLSREVEMMLNVEEAELQGAQRALISNHARRVRTV